MKGRSLVIALIVLVVMIGGSASVGASSILVLDHGFAKDYTYTRNGHIILLNRTSTFTQDDIRICAYLKATFYSANLTWTWYDPSGQLYDTSSYQANCVASPCDEIVSIRLSGSPAATRTGLWTVNFLVGGSLIYSDNFWLRAVVTQDNYWNFTVLQSNSPRIQGSMRIIIHPSNTSWSYYRIYMPYAFNVTAYDFSTKQPLHVTTSSDSNVIVNLGGARTNGYSFVLKFDVSFVLQYLGGGSYVLTWREYPWERYNDVHTIPETYNVTLPSQATLLDVVGYNYIGLQYSPFGTTGRSIDIVTNVTGQRFGWSIFYRDLSGGQGGNGPSSTGPVNVAAGQALPVLPVTIGGLSAWSAVMSVFLLTASELASPIYSRGGYGILINRKRLRIAALVLVAFFLVTTIFQLTSQHALVQR